MKLKSHSHIYPNPPVRRSHWQVFSARVAGMLVSNFHYQLCQTRLPNKHTFKEGKVKPNGVMVICHFLIFY
jgi:hypothetical protein